MTGYLLIIAFILSIVVMITAISKFKIHPFLVIMGISLLLGMIAGIPLLDQTAEDGTVTSGLATVIGTGFSGTFTSIGIVIIFGALIGNILEKTGAALKLADMVIHLVGKKHPAIAMELMGWVVSIPVFCDSGFVILNPIRKALVNRTGASSVAMTVSLSAGLYIAHVFIPPTPGPIAAASTLGIGENLLLVMGLGVLCSVFPLITGGIYASYIGKKITANDETASNEHKKSYEQLVAEYGKLPNGFNALAPILVPIILMALSSVSSMAGWTSFISILLRFLGTPIIALSVGTILGIIQLSLTNKLDTFYELTNETLKTVGPILFITAAGGVLGKVISSTNMIHYITQNAPSLKTIGIFFPFILAAVLKTAQGSSTVALTTTAGIVVPILPALGLDSPVRTALAVMAIGAGAMTVSHANDSYFWVVTNFGEMTPDKGYRTQTIATLLLGLSGILEIFILSLFLH
ncbi:GntP family permease [Faecalicatena acetigenes]|uniref:GntP family permease n=1 Tax=Faecalicatena acetigenes TaxID=2981790 RepID=A0ABT2T8U8_9FIRM|nr:MULTISPECIES: GntP family permease [Lachnospiraceae]MCU6746421.1 GntP family permease [Faecalicatena acetigenes]SCH17324.1 5-keto-D-gluconate transporter [uncultured Clostridium sp.]